MPECRCFIYVFYRVSIWQNENELLTSPFGLGQGHFGKVYTAINNETGDIMAMKEIPLQPNDHKTLK